MGILEEVSGRYDTFSPVQKRIADYIFKYPDQVCFYSLKDFAESLGVTEVTILRFVKKAGIASFVELKQLLREHLQTKLNHGETLNRISDDVGRRNDTDRDKNQMLSEFVENEIQVIRNTYAKIGLDSILEATSLIRQAQHVYVVGTELVTGLCAYFTRRLQTIGIMAIDLSNMSRALYNNYASHIGPEDVVVLVSAPGYAKYIINTARYLEKHRVPLIVLTDRATAPAAVYGTSILLCDTHDLFFYNSVVGFLSAFNMLVYFSAMDDPEETNRLRGRLSEAREEIGSLEYWNSEIKKGREKKTGIG